MIVGQLLGQQQKIAGGGSRLNRRMFDGDWNPEEQNPEEQFFYESIFRLFKESKVEIASAITNPFPILMGLRDHDFISEQLYQHFIEACRNLVPVERVMYVALSEMEKTFDETVLEVLFSRVNLQAYPGLREIHRNFQNVILENFNYSIPDDEERNYNLSSQLSSEQGDIHPRERNPEHLSDGQQMSIRKEESSHDPNNTIETQEMTNECAQEYEQADAHEISFLYEEDSNAYFEPHDGEEPQGFSSSSSRCGPVRARGTSFCSSEDSNDLGEPCDREETQEFSYSPSRREPVLCDPETPQMITEKEQEEVASPTLCDREVSGEIEALQMDTERESEELPPSLLPWNEQVSGGVEALQMDTEGEPEELPPSLLPWNEQGTEKPVAVNEGYCNVMSSSKDMPEGTETRTESSRACDTRETANLGSNSTLGKLKRKRVRKKGHSWTRNKKKWRSNIHQKGLSEDVPVGTKARAKSSQDCDTTETVDLGSSSTLETFRKKRVVKKKGHFWSRNKKKWQRNVCRKGTRKHRDESVDFHAQILPVTCGALNGMLYKNKLKQGSIEKCIKREDGNWFTPREFEIKGGYERSKSWKLSVRCGGKPLKWLIEKGFLPNPPRKYGKRKKQRLPNSHVNTFTDLCLGNSDECEVCHDGGNLFCCDTCSRSFHEDCHLPPVETERNPWSCVFCRIKAYSASQKCHRESEVLEKQMGPEEQLVCEFLLVKVYCHPESSFFAKIPYYYYFNEASQNESMWLDKIKKRLKEQGYHKVEGFVQDMRLIFQNHKAYYKYNDFGQMGLKLEAEFEKSFKKVFAIQETNENSSLVQ